ncbi:urea carboxylase-associated family protein [Aquibium sp. A9E412]|uniref:urea carboxylase-associated family protein n=1 Tax=Aquibium sp. A9E412 TaxID=2976767 RepID=UPI0025B097DD|nr:urea carboxylase-associated family protein [Aquibium sp. A9E412]MDN2565751.1 urea carboxylase-associated family protein [Aquibium sp. A9E412]
MGKVVVPAREGRGIRVGKGEVLRITTPRGSQCADFFAFNAQNTQEFLSCPHTWVTNFSMVPREGDVFLSQYRRPMLKMAKDGAAGAHDMLITTCDQFRYEFFGFVGPHANCSDNLVTAMKRFGHAVPHVPQAVNFFAKSHVAEDGKLTSPPNPVAPGAYVEVEALIDLICVVSACPFDLEVDGWEVSGGHRHELSEIEMEIVRG